MSHAVKGGMEGCVSNGHKVKGCGSGAPQVKSIKMGIESGKTSVNMRQLKRMELLES